MGPFLGRPNSSKVIVATLRTFRDSTKNGFELDRRQEVIGLVVQKDYVGFLKDFLIGTAGSNRYFKICASVSKFDSINI